MRAERTDGGNGHFVVEHRQMQGAPDQQYVTGIDRWDESHALKHWMPRPEGGGVTFDGHGWRGHPPRELFQEVKGHYSWMWPKRAAKAYQIWETQLQSQISALQASARPGYIHEMVFTEKSVMEDFMAYLGPEHPIMSEVDFRFEPMP